MIEPSPAANPSKTAQALRVSDRLKARKPDAFEEIVRTHGGRLLQVARRYLGEEDARDAVQEAFLSAFRGIDRFQGQADMGTWLHRIVVNAALKVLRTKRPEREQPIEDFLPTFDTRGYRESVGPAWRQNIHELLERDEVRKAVLACIHRLPESYRTVLLLRDIEEFSTAETALLLEISENAVKLRLHRGRQALRELIDRCLKEELQ